MCFMHTCVHVYVYVCMYVRMYIDRFYVVPRMHVSIYVHLEHSMAVSYREQ